MQLDEEIIFKVNNRNSTLNYDEDWDAWITVTVENSQPKGKIELNKKVNLRQDVDMSLIKDIDFTKISFELIAKENIINYTDGTIIYKAGQSIEKYNLTPEGTLTISDLWMGRYILKEISTIDGAVLDETQYDIECTQKDTVTKEYTVKTNIENNTTEIEISKTDITGKQEIEGANLTLFDENGEIIDTWVSTNKPHRIEGLKVGQKYILKEEKAPDSFVKEFIVENTANIQKVVMIDKMLGVKKTDFTTGEEIEGANLTITDEDGNVVDNWISKKEVHYVTGLEENKTYTLTEVTCPYRI